MWALNLMKYHSVAQYADDRATTISGAEADELYHPEGPLHRCGSRVLLIAEVVTQLVGDDIGWDRVAMAQKPHVILEGGGHFLQEDVSPAYNKVLCAWLRSTE